MVAQCEGLQGLPGSQSRPGPGLSYTKAFHLLPKKIYWVGRGPCPCWTKEGTEDSDSKITEGPERSGGIFGQQANSSSPALTRPQSPGLREGQAWHLSRFNKFSKCVPPPHPHLPSLSHARPFSKPHSLAISSVPKASLPIPAADDPVKTL